MAKSGKYYEKDGTGGSPKPFVSSPQIIQDNLPLVNQTDVLLSRQGEVVTQDSAKTPNKTISIAHVEAVADGDSGRFITDESPTDYAVLTRLYKEIDREAARLQIQAQYMGMFFDAFNSASKRLSIFTKTMYDDPAFAAWRKARLNANIVALYGR